MLLVELDQRTHERRFVTWVCSDGLPPTQNRLVSRKGDRGRGCLNLRAIRLGRPRASLAGRLAAYFHRVSGGFHGRAPLWCVDYPGLCARSLASALLLAYLPARPEDACMRWNAHILEFPASGPQTGLFLSIRTPLVSGMQLRIWS